jgi:PAS domain-containing protein
VQLHEALDQQADLHKENARLFSATEAREARLSQILHSTSDGIIFVSPDGRIEAANVRAGDLLGFDPQTVIGMDVMRILARLYSLGGGDSFGVTLKELLADPGPGGHGDLQQPATGRVFHWVAQPTRDGGGGTVGLTFTFQDVTPTRDLSGSSKTSRDCSRKRAARPKKRTARRESSSPTSPTRCARRSARSSA